MAAENASRVDFDTFNHQLHWRVMPTEFLLFGEAAE
jgi:hypothetical protein